MPTQQVLSHTFIERFGRWGPGFTLDIGNLVDPRPILMGVSPKGRGDVCKPNKNPGVHPTVPHDDGGSGHFGFYSPICHPL